MIRRYHETIVIEVGGHDHFGDLRFHSSNGVAGLPDSGETFNFHNLLVTPGCTPYGGSNPGIAMFEVSKSMKPQNLRFEFLDLDATFGQQKFTYADATFYTVNYAS